MSELVVGFEELALADVALVGGKCANLGELTGAGFPVPPGFAVTTEAYRLAGPGAEAVPAEAAAAIRRAYEALEARFEEAETAVAVRSSAVAEDGAEASFAGVQDTYLWLRGAEAVLDGVRRCWRSIHNPEAVAYRAERGLPEGSMSVAVQAMVDARVAGVMFSLNPVSGDPSSVAIDASWGLGVTVVGGDVTPDSYLVNKITRALLRADVGTKEVEVVPDPDGTTRTVEVEAVRRARPCLDEADLARLVDLARAVERHYGHHVDVEWAIDRRRDELFLLQSRPETVWSQRAKPAPAPVGALAAVAATFTGRAGRS
jgi:pyruvate,water dikinase